MLSAIQHCTFGAAVHGPLVRRKEVEIRSTSKRRIFTSPSFKTSARKFVRAIPKHLGSHPFYSTMLRETKHCEECPKTNLAIICHCAVGCSFWLFFFSGAQMGATDILNSRPRYAAGSMKSSARSEATDAQGPHTTRVGAETVTGPWLHLFRGKWVTGASSPVGNRPPPCSGAGQG